MAYDILQSSTQSALLFFLVQTADHITGLTGASPTVTLSKNGAAFGAASGSVTEISSGWYKVAGNATDTATLGPLALHATAASGDPCDILVANIVSYNPQSATNLGLSALPTATAGASGGLLISGSNSGTTTLAALTITGSTTMSDGLLISRSSSNTSAITATGNGTGSGIVATSGSGATGDGMQMTAVSTAGNGLKLTHTGSGIDLNATTTNSLAVNATQIGTQTASASGTVTFPNATLASTTNITAGTITTVTNLTNAPTSGDFTATMKTSLNSSTPTSVTTVTGNVNGSVGSVTGAVGSVTGAVGSVTGAVGSVTGSIGSLGTTAKTDVSTAVLTTQMTEAYSALHTAPTLAQAMFEVRGILAENNVASTTVTVKKVDGSTTAETFTINDATSPTSITRAS